MIEFGKVFRREAFLKHVYSVQQGVVFSLIFSCNQLSPNFHRLIIVCKWQLPNVYPAFNWYILSPCWTVHAMYDMFTWCLPTQCWEFLHVSLTCLLLRLTGLFTLNKLPNCWLLNNKKLNKKNIERSFSLLKRYQIYFPTT